DGGPVPMSAARRGVRTRSARFRSSQSCGLLFRVVELDGHGPRYTVAEMDSRVHHACSVCGHHLAQKLQELCDVKHFLFTFHNSPSKTLGTSVHAAADHTSRASAPARATKKFNAKPVQTLTTSQ